MGEIQDPQNEIVKELVKMNKRLNGIHSWLAAFIVISVFFYLIVLGIVVFPF
ncbi:MAG: hypothetical protein ACFFG0_24170 [Candidatus Thorarchaeota archaeon]